MKGSGTRSEQGNELGLCSRREACWGEGEVGYSHEFPVAFSSFVQGVLDGVQMDGTDLAWNLDIMLLYARNQVDGEVNVDMMEHSG